MRESVFALGACALAVSTAAHGDIITHFGSGVGHPVIPQQLDAVGIGSGNVGSENAATSFTVPGNVGDPVNVSFRFRWDTGTFQFCFGFTRVNGIGFDPVLQRQQWATEALSAARSTDVFSDPSVDPIADSGTYTLTGGDELVFFIVPDNTTANFRANPASFYADPSGLGGGNNALRSPLFSYTPANPGEFDQLLSFAANGVTMFAFEDLVRTGASDQNFADLIFTVNAEIIPAPASGALLGLALLATRRRRAR